MKLSCTDIMVPGESLTSKAVKLKNWGYDGIAVFVNYNEWSASLRDEVLNLENRTGILPCEFVFGGPYYGHLMSNDQQLSANARKMYSDAVNVCVEIGAVTELEYSYGPQNTMPLFSPYAKMNKNEEDGFIKMYRELASSLNSGKGQLLLENINRYESPYLNNLSDCIEIVKKINVPGTGVLVDLFHMSIEESDLPQSLIKAGKFIKHVHLGDNNRLEPGRGNIDWAECMAALKQVKYEGFLNLECGLSQEPEKALPQTAEFLKSMF